MVTFQQVVDHFGGLTQMASELGITSQAISQWDELIPEGRAYQIEVVTRGRFKANQLPVRRRTPVEEGRASA